MKTAIIYSSKYGTTEKVAGTIAEKLSATNEVELISLKNNPNPDISGFAAVILGVSVYAGQVSGKMKSFCKANETVLLQKKTGLFVCGMEPDMAKRRKELSDAYPAVLSEKAVATGFLGGEFQFEKMNFMERMIIKKIAKTDKSVQQIDQIAIESFVGDFLAHK
jgi:menaquinone-dependent protoporphyrinogen oxidase